MISIVIPSRSAEKLAAATAHYHELFADHAHEVVAITDAPSMCAGYNRALERVRGELVVFSHDDVEALDAGNFARRLMGHMETYEVVGVAGTSRLTSAGWVVAGAPHIFGQVLHPLPTGDFILCIYGNRARINPGMQAMDGLFLAFRREVIAKLRWDAATFGGFHLYDVDVTFRAYLGGHKLAVACDLPLVHSSGGAFDARWEADARRFAEKFGPYLLPALHPAGNFTSVRVGSREEALARMAPPHWG